MKARPRGHRCRPPSAFTWGTGTIWQCDECGTQWKRTGEHYTNEGRYPMWRRVWFRNRGR